MNDRLILWAWFNPELVRNVLIPDIEEYCTNNKILYPNAYDIFQTQKFAKNSLYFHHAYAEKDIPIGQEYNMLAFRKDYKSEFQFVQVCHAKVLCFFTAFKTQPCDFAAKGHHELSLIKFEPEIPRIIYDRLYEITELVPLANKSEICLYLE